MAARQRTARAYVSIHDTLVAEITSGRLPVGHQLASETDLAQQFGVGRPTVRQALGLLRSNGWIVSRRGSGSFVQRSVPRPTLMGFDGLTSSLVAQGRLYADEVLGQAVVDHPATEVIAIGAPGSWWQVTRLRSVDHAGAMVPYCVEVDAFPLDRIADAAERFARTGSATGVLAGTVLSQCEVAIRAVAASRNEADRLQVGRGAPLLAMERVNRSNDGHVVHVGLFRFNTGVMPLQELQVNPPA